MNSFLEASSIGFCLLKKGYPKNMSNQGLVKLTTDTKKMKKWIIKVVTGHI